jgi:division protein CdvB (Snf7/Vps24/ESCRT-III family)
MVDEMLDDTMEGLFDDEDEEIDDAVSEIMDEIGINFGQKLNNVNTSKIELKENKKVDQLDDEDEDIDLMKKLSHLKE